MIEAEPQVGTSLARLVETLDQRPERLWCPAEGRYFPADRFAFMPRRGVMHVLKAHYPAVRQDPPPDGRPYPDDIDDDPPPPPSGGIEVQLRPGQKPRQVFIDIPDPVPMEPVGFDLIQEDALALVFRPTTGPGAARARPGARHYAMDLPQQALARWRAGSAGGPGGEPGRPRT